ncbi:MAG: DUF4398 domain-containing protein, partial [Woeseiaceae bacterium]
MNLILNGRAMLLMAVPIAALGGACASSPDRPFQELARAEASVEQAQQAGVQEYGAVELEAAQTKLVLARTAADDNDDVMAGRYAREAALDANLAMAITRNRQAELSVEELN